jgi:carboxyl-terminal processing protease
VPSEMIDEIVANGEKEGIEKNAESLAFSLESLKKEIKAFIARDIYSRNDFFKVLYSDDEAILKALEVIENQKEYNNLLVSTE